MKRFWPLLLFLPACVREPVEKPLVDLTKLAPHAVRKMPAAPETGNPFKRLYAPPASPDEQPAWLGRLRDARELDLTVLKNEGEPSALSKAELAWTKSAFVEVPVPSHDRYFYDPGVRRYTVGRYLDDLNVRFGGADLIVLNYAYPNLGVDERGQLDMLHDLPGGTAALKRAVELFHSRGVHVLLPFHSWDKSASPAALSQALKETGADGYYGDTLVAPDHELFKALGETAALEPEAGFGDSLEGLLWTPFSRADWRPYKRLPGVDRYRWIEPRHLSHAGVPGETLRLDALQYAWLNGAGVLAVENHAGIWNGIVPREAEAIRRMAMVYRALPEFARSPEWEPYTDTLQTGDVVASRFPLPYSGTVWTFVNRGDHAVSGPLLEIEEFRGQHFYNLWNGEELFPDEKLINRPLHSAELSFAIEPHGFGAVIEVNEKPTVRSPLWALLPALRKRARSVPFVNSLSPDWRASHQRIVENPPTPKRVLPPSGMILIPGIKGWRFAVSGTEFESSDGVDVQYPWETHPQREHEAKRDIEPFYLDRLPVTNLQFRQFLTERDFHPADTHNFLRDWPGGKVTEDTAQKPVTWVGIEEARLYCLAYGKRLPHEWEWQYAAQGSDSRPFPWGHKWDQERVPVRDTGPGRKLPPDVGSYPAGASPFGVLDMVGLVWQWTEEFFDEHTRAAVLKGGSYYQPAGSPLYFNGNADEGDDPSKRGHYQVDHHSKYLLMDPSLDRAGTIGFRCAADAPR